MSKKEDKNREKSVFSEFVRELLRRKNLSFRKAAQIARELGFETSASAIYKSIHNSKKTSLKPEHINMFATIFNLDRSQLVKKLLDDKYMDYFFEDVTDEKEICEKAVQFVKEGKVEEAKYIIGKYMKFLRDLKEENDWRKAQFDLNMRFIFSLRDMGKHTIALEQCRILLNRGGHNINDTKPKDLVPTIDILHMMTCLLYRLNRKAEFDLYYNAGVYLAEKMLGDLFQKLRFDAVRANLLYDNGEYHKAVLCNQQIVEALRKSQSEFKEKNKDLYQKYLCNLSSALTNLGWVMVETAENKNQIKKGIDCIREAYENMKKIGRKKLLAHVIFYLARAYHVFGDYQKAKNYFFKSKKIAESELFLDLIAFNYWGLSLAYQAEGDHKRAEQYHLLAKSEIKKVEEDTREKREVESYLESHSIK
jgi:tetratricopeptide (TPR) repeat protein